MLITAKVSWSSSLDEIVRALTKNGQEVNPTFKLTDGPVGSSNFGVARVRIPDDLRSEGDSGLCLVLGLGEIMYFFPPAAEGKIESNGII